VHDTYRVRVLLESEAVKLSVDQGSDTWLRKDLPAAFEAFSRDVRRAGTKNPLAWSQSHRDFHFTLMGECGSLWLIRLLDTLHVHTERYRLLSQKSGARNPVAEHQAIYDAAMDRDAEGTVKALQEHLEQTVRLVERHFAAIAVADAPAKGRAAAAR
jgi:DNA-binding GntR family transcriptional regulator